MGDVNDSNFCDAVLQTKEKRELLVVNLVPPQHNPQLDSEFARLAQNMSLSSDVRAQ
jgi:hypothetical protein